MDEENMKCIAVDTVLDVLSQKLCEVITNRTQQFLNDNPDVTMRVNKKDEHGKVESPQGKAILVGPADKLELYYKDLINNIFVEWKNEKEES